MTTIETRLFGTISVEDDKIITFEDGIIGFPDLKHFTLIHDAEKEDGSIMWLQSCEEPAMALTVVDPTILAPDYQPEVSEEALKPLGDLTPFNTFVLTTLTVPHDITQMSMNQKAPLIINSDTNKACQIILDGDYEVKHKIYDRLKEKKAQTISQ
ncbi:MAG: flagellar assembly protein FliW [Lachnospiraceae bacterium]